MAKTHDEREVPVINEDRVERLCLPFLLVDKDNTVLFPGTAGCAKFREKSPVLLSTYCSYSVKIS